MVSNNSFTRRAGLLACSLVAGIVLAGCAGGGGYRDYGGGYGRAPQSGPMSNQEASRMAYEQELERRVMSALRADPRVGAQGLTVKSEGDGVVAIGGTPANGAAGRDLALMIARSVPGVRRAVNTMTVN
ncbi:MAG: BON domain-containing protein [Comamonadaceae bacterium]|nr:BON domain-containing protein [Comamonadaceae bacterium]